MGGTAGYFPKNNRRMFHPNHDHDFREKIRNTLTKDEYDFNPDDFPDNDGKIMISERHYNYLKGETSKTKLNRCFVLEGYSSSFESEFRPCTPEEMYGNANQYSSEKNECNYFFYVVVFILISLIILLVVFGLCCCKKW